MKTLVGLLVASSFALLTAQQAQAVYVSGTDHGYFYEGWADKGSLTFTFPYAGSYAGNFVVTWKNCNDGGGGKGWKTGSDTRNINYNSGTTSGFNNFGGYGWAPYPDYELYITDRGRSSGSTSKGTVNSDGGTYNVYLGKQASYSGGGPQFISSRTSATSASGNKKITTSNHINYWKSKGMTHGSWGVWKLNFEQYGSNVSGSGGATIW